MTGALNVTIDEAGMIQTLGAIGKLERDLRDQANGRLRAAAATAGAQLVKDLKAAALRSQTPQARIVAESIRVKRDRLVSVSIGGGQPVGSRGTPAGDILFGSERGGRNFDAPKGGAYWIGPTRDTFASGAANRIYVQAVNQVLNDSGLT